MFINTSAATQATVSPSTQANIDTAIQTTTAAMALATATITSATSVFEEGTHYDMVINTSAAIQATVFTSTKATVVTTTQTTTASMAWANASSTSTISQFVQVSVMGTG